MKTNRRVTTESEQEEYTLSFIHIYLTVQYSEHTGEQINHLYKLEKKEKR